MIRALHERIRSTGSVLLLMTDVRGLHAAAYLLGASAVLSSLLALFRDRLLATSFGAGAELDLYYAAFRIPDFLFVLLGAIVSVYALIPALTNRSDEEKREYFDTIILGFSALACAVSGVAYLYADELTSTFFPLIAANQQQLLTTMTHILLLQPLLLGASNIVASVTQYKRRYFLYALTPIVYNVGIIIGILFFEPVMGLEGLAWGVILGAALHFGIQIPSALSDGYFRIPRTFRARLLWNTVRVSLPRALALSVGQVSFLILLAFAGALSAGSVAIFMFAFNVHAVPLAIIGASYSVAAFPSLVALAREQDAYLAQVLRALKHILFWSLPILGIVIILRAHVVRVILGAGSFDWTDTRLTAAALALFMVSLSAQCVSLLLVRAYYARGMTLMPVIMAFLQLGLTVFGALFFLFVFESSRAALFLEDLLRVNNLFGTEVLMLPLAYSCAALLTTLFLAIHFNYALGRITSAVPTMWEGITAAFAGSLAAYGVLLVLGTVTLSSTLASVLFKGGTAGIMGIMASACTYYLLGSAEYRETVAAVRARVWRGGGIVGSAEGAGVPR